MGIPACMKLLREKKHSWSTSIRLRDSKLVIDATDDMHWFTKKHVLDRQRMDKFGTSMVAYGQFMKSFFKRLLNAHIKPIVVYNGARLSEQTHGPLVSKAKHMEKSARIRMYKMNRYQAAHLDDCVMPCVASNVLKQIINELDLEAHQSTYEVYPLLIRLANENDCPVLTSHSDFIFANVKRGFLLAEEFGVNSSQQLEAEVSPLSLYQHQLMLADFGLQASSAALYALNVLLRPDFSGKYSSTLNSLFRLSGSHLAFRQDNTEFVQGRPPDRRVPFLKRLVHILGHWPSELTEPDHVRRAFQQHLPRTANKDEAMQEYDSLWCSFSDSNDNENISALLPAHLGQLIGLQEALTKRESTAPFLTDILMPQTNFNRTQIEDLTTFRSAYSMQDPAKLLLMNRGRIQRLRLLDRRHTQLEFRHLKLDAFDSRLAEIIEAPDQLLYEVFYFPPQVSNAANLRAFIRDSRTRASLMRISLSFKDERVCEQLIVLLLLARFGFMLAFRENHDHPKRQDSSSSSLSKPPKVSPTAAIKSSGSLKMIKSSGPDEASQSSSLTEKMKPNEAKYGKFRQIYYDSIYNSFIYYAFKNNCLRDRREESELLHNQNDGGGFYAQANLASQDIESNKIDRPADISNTNYLQIKHLNEIMNSSLKAYMELNSFYNYPGTRLQLADYFDCLQIYKICSYLSTRERTTTTTSSSHNLLRIETDDRLFSLLQL